MVISHKMIINDPLRNARLIMTHTEAIEGIVAVLGAIFSATLVPAFAVHCSPHEKPSGQQLPPRLAAQLYHALGQLPPCVATLAPVGAMMVTPFVLTIVVLDGRAHEPVVWQSRPTRQQPEGKYASQT